MKKMFTSMVMAFMLMAVPSQAQVKFGVMGGLNVTNMSLSTATNVTSASGVVQAVEESMKNKAGFFIGPTVNFTLPIVGLGVDVSALYDQRSGESEGETFKSQSIQVPLNVRYGIGLGSIANVFAFVGPQFGFNVGGATSWKGAQDVVKEWKLKDSNLSLNLGIGATVLGHLQAKINYNIAMGKTGEINSVADATTQASSAITAAAGEVLGMTETKANCWQVSIAYIF